ncbi:MAG TPA: hypothetical protein VNQ53_09580 [Nocardioides sp.]|nr:hypothetical protein [Nocardioides sp.]
MARGRRGSTGKPGRRVTVVGVLAAVALAGAVAGCSGDPAEESPTPRASVALRVTTVEGTAGLDERTRTDLETEVGDVLSRYVVSAFLGDYPREDFVQSFDSFTSGAARRAVRDIDLLTAARFGDATSMRATQLDARLSFLVDGDDVIGTTAGLRFGFEATTGDGGPSPFTMRGRFMLVEEDGTWSVFGYDVSRDDGGPVESGASP